MAKKETAPTTRPVPPVVTSILGLATVFLLGYTAGTQSWSSSTMADTGNGRSVEVAATEVENVAYKPGQLKQGDTTRGFCKVFTGGKTIIVCVPRTTPKGSVVTKVYEDGSAKYRNGSVYRPASQNFG